VNVDPKFLAVDFDFSSLDANPLACFSIKKADE